MTDVIEMIDPVTGEIIDQQKITEQLLAEAKEKGISLVGPDGLLAGLTKRVLETALEARGHFPNDAAALKCLYLVTRSLDPTGRGRARWVTRGKPALDAFAITFEGRIN